MSQYRTTCTISHGSDTLKKGTIISDGDMAAEVIESFVNVGYLVPLEEAKAEVEEAQDGTADSDTEKVNRDV